MQEKPTLYVANCYKIKYRSESFCCFTISAKKSVNLLFQISFIWLSSINIAFFKINDRLTSYLDIVTTLFTQLLL